MDTRTKLLGEYLIVIQEMNKRIKNLEHIVQQQAGKLAGYENRCRRNNILVFGVPESEGASMNELTEAIVGNLFKEKLGVEVKTIEKIHRLGKERPDRTRCYMNFGVMQYLFPENCAFKCNRYKHVCVRIWSSVFLIGTPCLCCTPCFLICTTCEDMLHLSVACVFSLAHNMYA